MPGNSPPRGDSIGLIVAVMVVLALYVVYEALASLVGLPVVR
jgi:hypothetical protein